MLLVRALNPTAVLEPALVFLVSAPWPTAVLFIPLVRLRRALVPSAVLPFGYPPSGAGGGSTARAGSPKQATTRTSAPKGKPRRKNKRLTKFKLGSLLTLSGLFRACMGFSFFSRLVSRGYPALKRARELPGGKIQCPIQSAARLHERC